MVKVSYETITSQFSYLKVLPQNFLSENIVTWTCLASLNWYGRKIAIPTQLKYLNCSGGTLAFR